MYRDGLIVGFLSALVVLCPFQCILAEYFSVDAITTAESCTCCPAHGQDDGIQGEQNSPTNPDECSCRDCFCRGALPVHDSDVGELAGLDSAAASFDVPHVFSTQVELEAPLVASHSFLMPFLLSGHNLRAALSNWCC